MKKNLLKTILFVFCSSSTAFAYPVKKMNNSLKNEAIPSSAPLFQLSGGFVYSSIDLSRYINSEAYRGLHVRLVTHLGGLFFLSTEYSTFPVHKSPSVWEDVHTRKFDVNGHISFATNNNLTRIYALSGINKHEWSGRRTAYTNLGQLGDGISEGTYVKVNRWGVNFGCGFTQALYENIGVSGDFRFCFSKSTGFEKVRIMDVMTTLGVNFTIPHPAKSNGTKRFGIGKKIYKWTQKGAK